MKDYVIKVNTNTRENTLPRDVAFGVQGENVVQKLVFELDTMIDGIGWVEVKQGNTKGYIQLDKIDNGYEIEIKNSLLTEPVIYVQLRITKSQTPDEEIPVFKSKVSYINVHEAINATTTIPDEYPEWLDIANAKILEMDQALTEVDNLDIDITKEGSTTTIEVTKKDGTTKSEQVLDGRDGTDGKDAKINGVNTLTIEAGTNIGLTQEGSTLTIENTYDDSTITGDISDLKAKDIDLQEQIDAITASSDVVDIVATYTDLQNYDTSKLTNDDIVKVLEDSTHSNAVSYYRWVINGTGSWSYVGSESPTYTKSETDTLLNAKQDKIDSLHKLSADLVDDSSATNKFVTASDKTAWNAKYDKPASGIPKTDLASDVQTSLGKADTAIQDVSEKLDTSDAVSMFSNAVYDEVTTPSKNFSINSAYSYYGRKLRQDKLEYDLQLLGESTQDGTPSPSVPIEIESIESPVEITSIGENKFNIATVENKNINITTGEETSNTYWKLSDYIKVKSSTTYTASWKNLATDHIFVKAVYYNEAKTFISGEVSDDITATNYSFTTPSTAKYIKFAYLVIYNDVPAPRTNIMINEGTTASSYKPYVKNTVYIPLAHDMRSDKDKTVRDRKYWQDGKWYDEQKLGYTVQSGTTVTISDAKSNGKYMSTHKEAGTLDGTSLTFDSEVTDAEIIYELATPILTEITDTATIGTLESIRTYTGLTEITSDIDITGSYVQDLNKLVEQGENNVEDVKVNGTSVVTNKVANVTVPTKTSDLTNDSNFAKTNQNNNFSTAQTINGTLTVVGDISQTGTSYETHAEQLYTKKDLIKTRDGAVGGLGNDEVTGIEALLYDGTNNGRLVFDNTGTARVGDVDDEVPLLARDESANMSDGKVLTWDGTNLIAKTTIGMVTCTQAQYDALVSGGTVDSNTYYFIEEE